MDVSGTLQPGTSSEKLLPSAPSAQTSPYPPDIELDKPSIAEVRKARQEKARQAAAGAVGNYPGEMIGGGPPGGGGGGGGMPPPGGGAMQGDLDGMQQNYEVQVGTFYASSFYRTIIKYIPKYTNNFVTCYNRMCGIREICPVTNRRDID